VENTTPPVSRALDVERWPTELPLFALVALCSVFVWILLIVTVIGLVYAAFLGVFFFVAHVIFMSRVQGSGAKLGPDQFPEIHDAVARLSRQMGMEPPEAYIVQSGGSLNALATRFFRRKIIVLFSDLLEACGANTAARDMIIGHELAHLKCGHLNWQMLILPGLFVPFLGSALSRAREYTCDRFGLAVAGDPGSGLRGLSILAAGPVYGARMNMEAFTRQRSDMSTGLMTLAEWLSSHPPLAKRVAALSPEPGAPDYSPARGNLRALGILGTAAALFVVMVVGAAVVTPWLIGSGPFAAAGDAARVQGDFEVLSAFIEEQWPDPALYPESMLEIRERWERIRSGEPLPIDPFDGYEYGFASYGDFYEMWSSGLDGRSGTDDDIYFDGPPY